MPDLCDLILDEHEGFRRRFAELDSLRAAAAAPERLARVWGPLAEQLELHASAEESVFYPHLLQEGKRGEDETTDAINDHNDIRDAIRQAASEDTGAARWWEAVASARAANSDHMAEEEREAIPDFRVSAPDAEREALGAAFVAYHDEHAGGRGLDTANKDTDAYLARHDA
ncbi:MAG: hemerythrin domain-containing protein [Actinomycetota bacterium]|nr:hemerythrin domain-containing protein [Actinomycetota bacterium]